MFSFLKRRKRREAVMAEALDKEWNACLQAVLDLLSQHRWAVEEDDPQEIFCDGCGETLNRALGELRR